MSEQIPKYWLFLHFWKVNGSFCVVIFTPGSWFPCVLCYFHSCKHCWKRGWMSGTNTRQMASLLWPIDPSYLITFLVQEQRQCPSDKWFFSELLASTALWFLLYSGRDRPISAPTKAESDEMLGGRGLPFCWKKRLALPTATEGIWTQITFSKDCQESLEGTQEESDRQPFKKHPRCVFFRFFRHYMSDKRHETYSPYTNAHLNGVQIHCESIS